MDLEVKANKKGPPRVTRAMPASGHWRFRGTMTPSRSEEAASLAAGHPAMVGVCGCGVCIPLGPKTRIQWLEAEMDSCKSRRFYHHRRAMDDNVDNKYSTYAALRQEKVNAYTNLLVHASTCQQMEALIAHSRTCLRIRTGDCKRCKLLLRLTRNHAHHCCTPSDHPCRVHGCDDARTIQE
jgi:hypothetical protein